MDSREQSCHLFPCSRQSLLLAVTLYARLIGPYASGNPVSASYGSADYRCTTMLECMCSVDQNMHYHFGMYVFCGSKPRPSYLWNKYFTH